MLIRVGNEDKLINVTAFNNFNLTTIMHQEENENLLSHTLCLLSSIISRVSWAHIHSYHRFQQIIDAKKSKRGCKDNISSKCR